VIANPSSIRADGISTSTITATVVNSAGGAMAGVPVMFTLHGTPGACGTAFPSLGVTNASGIVALTYTASTSTGFCTISATQAASGGSGSVTITQVV
jgi:adhesin/invasin